MRFCIALFCIALAIIAAFCSEAAAQGCGMVRGQARFNCMRQTHPGIYEQCNAFAIERGYDNIAPGKGRFVMECIRKRSSGGMAGGQGGGQRTCSAQASLCTSFNGSEAAPKCEAARDSCLRTGVFIGPRGRAFRGLIRS
jgi:hypothetical protein